MKLLSTIESYVALKRALGAVFSVDARILRSFGNETAINHRRSFSSQDTLGSRKSAMYVPPSVRKRGSSMRVTRVPRMLIGREATD